LAIIESEANKANCYLSCLSGLLYVYLLTNLTSHLDGIKFESTSVKEIANKKPTTAIPDKVKNE
jgi:hypothetical protein